VANRDPKLDGPETRVEVAKVRRHLFIYFVLGGVGLAIAVAWAAKSLPEGGLPEPYAVGAGGGGSDSEARTQSKERCTKFGDRCEHSPGKLGTCIQREGCTGAGCLFCQSQH